MAGLLLLLSSGSHALAQSEAASVLEELSRTVRQLYLNGYVVDIERHQLAEPHYGPGVGSVSIRPHEGVPLPVIHTKNDGGYDRITMARLGERFRYDLRNSGGQRWQWITDGQTLWCFREDLNSYTQTAAPIWPKQLSAGPGLPGDEWKYLTKFLAIAGTAEHARILSDDVAPDADCPGPSVIIEIDLAAGKDPAKELLRVLTQSHLPCHTAIDQTETGGRAISTDRHQTITWKFHSDPPAPDYFNFSPRKNARKVKRFPRQP